MLNFHQNNGNIKHNLARTFFLSQKNLLPAFPTNEQKINKNIIQVCMYIYIL